VRQFAELLYTDEAGLIRGVYVEDKFAFPVIQQPEGKDLFVSSKLGRVTQFNLAAQNGITGLLAHNFLSGKEFYEIETGDTIWIIYGDKELASDQVTSIRSYQKLIHPTRKDYHDMYDHTNGHLLFLILPWTTPGHLADLPGKGWSTGLGIVICGSQSLEIHSVHSTALLHRNLLLCAGGYIELDRFILFRILSHSSLTRSVINEAVLSLVSSSQFST
jgi:hypothetical protein